MRNRLAGLLGLGMRPALSQLPQISIRCICSDRTQLSGSIRWPLSKPRK